MSSFALAISLLLTHEGGFVDHPADPGGATNYGISLSYLSSLGDLDGDGYQDGDLDKDGDVDAADIRALTRDEAIHLYATQWWERYGYDRIQNQVIAAKVFDLAVNMGARQAHRVVQRALRSAGVQVAEDGILGPKTLAAINGVMSWKLLPAIRSEAAGFYRSLQRPEFIQGWLNRAYA